MRQIALVAVCFLATPCFVAAQEARVSGTVTDDTGGVLPGVTVEASGAAPPTGPRTAVTDGDGRYVFTALPPGRHVVTFTLPGFEREETEVDLTAGMTAVVDADLRVGGLFEEVTVAVTGTAIDAPAINMPHAVTVVSRETLERQGVTQLVDLFRNLNVSHGVVGERNSWYNSNQPATLTETVANVNLRGLGASRTLVLINGRRHVPVPARLIGGRFVDVNTIPAIAVGRLEVLKEGASATYGSDAVGGVANFVTRGDFRGFEVNVAHDYFDGGGDTNVAGIWGGRIGSSSAVFSAERVGRQELRMEERPWTLDRLSTFPPGSRAGWSVLGNPGTFSAGAPLPWTGDVSDPRCTDFGGQDEGWTCRFRYAPYDNLIEAQQHTRAFAELNGPLNDRVDYHVEGLWADAVIPNWYTTPSYGPVSTSSSTLMEVAADHPGRQAFCAAYAGHPNADPTGACMADTPWYFHGRPFGSSGPARRVRRESRTQRVAASVDGDFTTGGRDAHWDLGVSYSRARGNFTVPGIYRDRIFRAFRGFGGPDCGVGVGADPTSPAGMRLGPLDGALAGQGPCQYYNPFSNAIEYSDQPGSRFRSTPNPDYAPALANAEALRRWLNEEVDLVGTTDLFVADATLSGNLVRNVADFAVGYQYRGMQADGDPNDPGDATLNPCAVVGDLGCSPGDQFGPYLFTGVHRPYAAEQQVQRLFGEVALGIGPRLDAQIAANYEFYDVAGRRVNSFAPKLAGRLQVAENVHYSLALRGSVQTTFRTPSLDDLNPSPLTTAEWVTATGRWNVVDRYGRPDSLQPERAFTYNAGAVLFLEGGVEATVDYWRYDFENVIGSMPHDAIASLYASDDSASRAAVSRFIVCPGGRASEQAPEDRCAVRNLERIQIDLVNWPGLTTSGVDTHFAVRTDVGPGQFSASWDSTYTVGYESKALVLEGTDFILHPGGQAAGYLNFAHPIAVPLPRWKSRWSASWDWSRYSLANYVSYISAYEDRGAATTRPRIDPFLTWDMSFLWRFPGRGMNLTVYAMNLTGQMPPWANVEQSYDGFTHDPKGRRIKMAVSWRFGG